ncbi:MAG: hypothetical protein K6G33_06585 [Ruminococcus sp.]|uniref:hypothetical protein n=1 Tax=Ruminococcus sp. TaxID=41978 RepID=UPI0025EDCB19|nr:hypothetical protein [Ruminococcus sp.]MCR5600385.1 hypothetical protein [Ruminococcus sp.]
MRSYEDISNRIMQRGDQIIESRKVRAAKIRHTSYAVSGMCAAVITGIGVWRVTSSMPKPDNQHNSSMISTTETTAEKTVTTADKSASTQPPTTEHSRNTTSSATVSSSTAPQTGSSSLTATARPKTTTAYPYTHTTTSVKPVQTSVPTSIIEATTTTSMNEGPVTAVPRPVTTTSDQKEIAKITKSSASSEAKATDPTTSMTQVDSEVKGTLPFDYSEAIRSSHGIFRYNDCLYEKADALVKPESIGDFIRNISVTFKVSNGWEIVEGMALYEINGIDKEEAVAARLNNTDEYFMFINSSYKKEDDIS